MNMLSNALISNSDMIKNYKICRQKADELGKIFILKNNLPDAVLFSIDEYSRLASIIEFLDNYSDDEVNIIVLSLVNQVTAPHPHIADTFA